MSLSPHGIRVFVVTPGFVHIELTGRMSESPEGRRWLPEAASPVGLDLALFVRLTGRVALGGADALNGRFLHALDDRDELLCRIDEIERDELHVPRLRRLPVASDRTRISRI